MRFITVHSLEALKSKAEITFLVCNIPIKNKEKVLELYENNSLYYIEYHNYKHSTKVMI